jgi:hypothetical protein
MTCPNACLGISVGFTMKVIAAYLLAVLGGKTSPTADDVNNILESGILLGWFKYCWYILPSLPGWNNAGCINS